MSDDDAAAAVAVATDWREAPAEHEALIAAERKEAEASPKSGARTELVQKRIMGLMAAEGADRESLAAAIDWGAELAAFEELDYPEYYRQPFHSVPNGWLSVRAATVNRVAMQAIYADAHPESCLGIRKDLAAHLPSDARCVVDLGAGDGDGASAAARLLPAARVIAVEASPFMIVAGRAQNPDVANLEWRHALAEATGLPDGVADAVTICLVFHECTSEAQQAIAAEALRLLRPGGTLVLTDTPVDDLHAYRGFYEPHKENWLQFDAPAFLARAGFGDVEFRGEIRGDGSGTDNALWTYRCAKPGARL